MQLSVQFAGESHVIPCGDGSENVAWLINEVRGSVQESSLMNDEVNMAELEARVSQSLGILMNEDKIKDVLNDNDEVFVHSRRRRDSNPLDPDLAIEEEEPYTAPTKILNVDGNSMTTADVFACGKGKYKIELTQDARDRVQEARRFLDECMASKKAVYGVNTGVSQFGALVIPDDKIDDMQINMIRSHAICVGQPISIERTRAMFALKINDLAKGYGGISMENLDRMVEIFNAGCVSLVPAKGSVGASGDLAPLAHLALGLLGEGKMWGPKTGWTKAPLVLGFHGLKPIELRAKEGLAMVMGTQFITSLGSEAVERAACICRQADIVATLSAEVLDGTTEAYREEIQNIRYHKGQQVVASRIRSLLNSDSQPSELSGSQRFCDKIQDPYTLGCIPQVHGISHDTIEFVRSILSTEVNSATGNPLVFAEIGETLSGGNFHGEYSAKSLDYLAIGIHEIASISERRLERLINPAYSELPALLTKDGGLNSGFMVAPVTAAALVSENKVLTHPSSVDSISTSAGTEDHVSMGGFAARKALEVVEHVETVVAIELMAACQALEFLRPLKTTEPLEAVHRLVRTVSKAFDTDRYFKPDIEAVRKLLQEGEMWNVVQPYMTNYGDDINRQENTE